MSYNNKISKKSSIGKNEKDTAYKTQASKLL